MSSLELQQAVLELEKHAAEAGWDQPARLYALVPTQDLLAAQPELADSLGGEGLTPVEQDPLTAELEEVLPGIAWPEAVAGCAVVVERLVLAQDDELPSDPSEAAAYVAEHPDKQEVRIVAAVDRGGATYCALRMRAHDDQMSVLVGPDLVPALLELITHTLTEG